MQVSSKFKLEYMADLPTAHIIMYDTDWMSHTVICMLVLI